MYSFLIIDDDPIARAYLSRIISKRFGNSIQTADNGIDGLKILHEYNPDLILLDISMPQMDGIEFLRTIRKEERYKNIPVLILSANNERDIIGKMIGLGITDYILKPIQVEYTYDRIQKALGTLNRK
ncbi:MAG: response regulator [Ignavibacteriaceae bacterium]